MKIKTNKFSLVGKYRDIAIAAGLFVIFDLFVLVLNFYTSFEIAEDATSINLAGRQRMLSQRMTKSLLQTEVADTSEQRKHAVDELDKTYLLFSSTFKAFYFGGTTTNTDGSSVEIKVVTDSESKQILKAAESIWYPLESLVSQLIKSPNDSDVLKSALVLANLKNTELLKLMNQLTTRLAVLAHEKAQRLRLFQSVGISFALINFVILLFHFIRKLGRSDAAADDARKETDEILETVGEGFFLIDKDLNLGHKYSKAMETIFKKEIIPGSRFLDLFVGKVNQKTLDMTKEYIELLFTKRIRENLATSLNPLVRLEIDLSQDNIKPDVHYLTINFKRVQSDDDITHVLGSVIDITNQVVLEQSLEVAESRAKEEIELLSQILQNDPDQISEYLAETKRLLLSINGFIEKSKSSIDYADIINQSLPAIHKIKGDASALGSELFVSLSHDFENMLKTVQYNTELTSEDLLPIIVQLNTMLAKINSIGGLIDKITKLGANNRVRSSESRSDVFQKDLQTLSDNVSKDLDKKVSLVFNQINLDLIEEQAAKSLRHVCIQMIRNAIAHGIEESSIRKSIGKPAYGTINVSIISEPYQTSLVIRDDGCGLSLNKIKRSILESGRLTKKQLIEMDDKSILMHIFYSGISTADKLSKHAGQGIGLTVVKQAIRDLDGRMNLNYKSGSYTEFHFVFGNINLTCNEKEVAA